MTPSPEPEDFEAAFWRKEIAERGRVSGQEVAGLLRQAMSGKIWVTSDRPGVTWASVHIGHFGFRGDGHLVVIFDDADEVDYIDHVEWADARVGAVAKLRRADYYLDERQHCLRLKEKGGKSREIPVRHDLEGFIDEYLAAAGTAHDSSPLFRSAIRKTKRLANAGMTGNDILRMVKRRFAAAGLTATRLTCHSFRATTITNLLEQGVSLDDVQYLAGHSDPRTTRLYDRRKKQVTRNIVERISI